MGKAIDKVFKLIDESDEFKNRFQNKMIKANIKRGLKVIEKESDLRGKLSRCLYKTPSIIEYRKFDENLYLVTTTKDDYWRTVDLSKNNAFAEVAVTYEAQLLITLQNKYNGLNSQFSHFASKMLGEEFLKNN